MRKLLQFIKIHKGKIFLGILILLLSGFFYYQNFISPQLNKKREGVKVRRGILEEKMTISGALDADEKATLQFQTAGRVSWVGVKEGDYVHKYQSIASLDQNSVQKNIQKYLNTYMKTRMDFDQANKDTYKDKVVTDTIKRELTKSQMDLNSSVLDVEIQDIAKKYANLWTPIEGVVVRVDTPNAGVNIIPPKGQYEIVNPKSVFFSLNAEQADVVRLFSGMSGELVLDAYPDRHLLGSIQTIAFVPKPDETGTVYAVKFNFLSDNSTYEYRIGMTGDVTFVTNRKENVLIVPVKFVKNESGKKYVVVLKNGKEIHKDVTTGIETDDLIEINSGILEGEVIYD